MELRGELGLVGGRPVLELQGVVDLATLPTLRDLLLHAATRHGGAVIVVDLDGVDVFDDTGLGVLLGTAGRLRQQGGDLVVVTGRSALAERLSTTGFDRAVTVVATLTAVPA